MKTAPDTTSHLQRWRRGVLACVGLLLGGVLGALASRTPFFRAVAVVHQPPRGVSGGEVSSTPPGQTPATAPVSSSREGQYTPPDLRASSLRESTALPADTDLPDALFHLSSPGDREERDRACRWMRQWSQRDPDAALRFAANLKQTPLRSAVFEQAILGWCDSDPANASLWVQNLENDPDKPRLLLAVAGEVLRTAPAETLALALKLEPGPERSDLIKRATQEWESRDPGLPAHWAEQHLDPGLRSEMLVALAALPVDHP